MTAGTRAGKRSAKGGSKRRRPSASSGRLGPHLSQQTSHLPRLFPRSRPKRPTTPRRHPRAWSRSHSRHDPWRNGQGANRLDLLPPIPGDVLFSGGGWHNLSATSLAQKSYAHPKFVAPLLERKWGREVFPRNRPNTKCVGGSVGAVRRLGEVGLSSRGVQGPPAHAEPERCGRLSLRDRQKHKERAARGGSLRGLSFDRRTTDRCFRRRRSVGQCLEAVGCAARHSCTRET
jgi:hypothetical protein